MTRARVFALVLACSLPPLLWGAAYLMGQALGAARVGAWGTVALDLGMWVLMVAGVVYGARDVARLWKEGGPG